ncbi:MAG: molybdenum ABC transporter ATP-binding protein [Pseudomonadota bacterium]
MSVDGAYVDITVTRPDFQLEMAQTVPTSGITAVFGPSGAGKTTFLRTIAGFETPTRGRIQLGHRTLCDVAKRINVPSHQRPIGYLFQDGRLFSHMTVDQNLAYAEARKEIDGGPSLKDDIISACGIQPFMDRRPETLSGGERQRVALARTLMTAPELLLLDEPLGALDRQRKLELVTLLVDLPKSLGIPTLYVSHDIDEVSRVADRVIILENGRVQNSGPVEETLGAYGLEAGRNPYESGARLSGTIAAHDPNYGLTQVAIGENTLHLPIHAAIEPGARIQLKISPKDVSVSLRRPDGISIQNVLKGQIEQIEEQGQTAFCMLTLSVDSQQLQARITRKARSELDLEIGRSVYVLLKSASFYR